jgi:chromosome segregation protein
LDNNSGNNNNSFLNKKRKMMTSEELELEQIQREREEVKKMMKKNMDLYNRTKSGTTTIVSKVRDTIYGLNNLAKNNMMNNNIIRSNSYVNNFSREKALNRIKELNKKINENNIKQEKQQPNIYQGKTIEIINTDILPEKISSDNNEPENNNNIIELNEEKENNEQERLFDKEIKINKDAISEKKTPLKENSYLTKIKELGSVNVDAIEEYKKTKERYEVMSEQRLDLETTMAKLRDVIQEMTKTMKEQFAKKFVEINKNFNEVFVQLFGGGKAELVLEDKENILECGIDIQAQPTGKKLQNMMLLSGGEKALTAIALLFAILKINPAPFCILDEIEAALDDVNVYRYAEFLKQFSINTQFLIITHRKGTMEAANTVYGVTMEENGISKLLSISLTDSEN